MWGFFFTLDAVSPEAENAGKPGPYPPQLRSKGCTMFQAATSGLDVTKIVLAIGALGTAAYGLVDVSKALWGGVSNCGFGDISKVISQLIPAPLEEDDESALSLDSVLATLKANWLNGMALADQKSVAKALIKLNLNTTTAGAMAGATGIDEAMLTRIAAKLPTGQPLTPQETDAFGRFDLLLSALLDQGYQRGDQRYRDSAKLAAVPVAIALAVLGALAIAPHNFTRLDLWRALACGLLATPLAPVAKDLASAIQAGSSLAQSWQK